eukprot:jgi/Mesvir1/4845/Mv25256-RA.1
MVCAISCGNAVVYHAVVSMLNTYKLLTGDVTRWCLSYLLYSRLSCCLWTTTLALSQAIMSSMLRYHEAMRYPPVPLKGLGGSAMLWAASVRPVVEGKTIMSAFMEWVQCVDGGRGCDSMIAGIERQQGKSQEKYVPKSAFLDTALFPGGPQYFQDSSFDRSKVMVVHNNWMQEKQSRLQLFKEGHLLETAEPQRSCQRLFKNGDKVVYQVDQRCVSERNRRMAHSGTSEERKLWLIDDFDQACIDMVCQ